MHAMQCAIICMRQLHNSYAGSECVSVSHSTRVLDGSCGFAVVLISQHIG